jgi:hypothetical protein
MVMRTSKTYFEQVSLEIVKKIAIQEIPEEKGTGRKAVTGETVAKGAPPNRRISKRQRGTLSEEEHLGFSVAEEK